MSEKEENPKEIVGYRQQPGKLPFSRPGSGGKENSQSLGIKK